MTADFLIGAIRASRDLHPLVRLKDLTRKERRKLNRIVRRQRKEWKRRAGTHDR